MPWWQESLTGLTILALMGLTLLAFGRQWGVRIILIFGALDVLFLAIFLPILFARDREDKRRAQLGLCPRCGYDLRATRTRCPECGFEPPSRAERRREKRQRRRQGPPQSEG